MNNVLYYLSDKFNTAYHSIRSFFRYKLKKTHLMVVKEAFNGYPYDFGFLLELEYVKLKEMLDYHEHSVIICEEERKRIIWQLKLAISLLEIITDRTDTCHFEYQNDNYPFEKIEGTDLFTVKEDFFKAKYHCDVKVNLRNKDRFLRNDSEKKYIDEFPDELYKRKARYLYYKLREQYEEEWWD